MACKMNENMSSVVYSERQEMVSLTKTPVTCPVCEKVWTHSWAAYFIVDKMADAFCSEVCRKSEPQAGMCGHFMCNTSGPPVKTMIPNPYHPKNQK